MDSNSRQFPQNSSPYLFHKSNILLEKFNRHRHWITDNYLSIYIYINIYIYIKADMSERHIYNLYIYISWCSSTLVLKTLNSAVFGIAVSPNVVDGILARWYFVLWSNMLSNAARKLCVFIPSPYFQMRATIISAVSNLSTAYNLVNVNLTNVAWLQWTSFGTWSTLQLQ